MNKRTDLWLTAISTVLLLTMPAVFIGLGKFHDHLLPELFFTLLNVGAAGWLIYRGNYKITNNEPIKANPVKDRLPTDEVL